MCQTVFVTADDEVDTDTLEVNYRYEITVWASLVHALAVLVLQYPEAPLVLDVAIIRRPSDDVQNGESMARLS